MNFYFLYGKVQTLQIFQVAKNYLRPFALFAGFSFLSAASYFVNCCTQTLSCYIKVLKMKVVGL